MSINRQANVSQMPRPQPNANEMLKIMLRNVRNVQRNVIQISYQMSYQCPVKCTVNCPTNAHAKASMGDQMWGSKTKMKQYCLYFPNNKQIWVRNGKQNSKDKRCKYILKIWILEEYKNIRLIFILITIE